MGKHQLRQLDTEPKWSWISDEIVKRVGVGAQIELLCLGKEKREIKTERERGRVREIQYKDGEHERERET